MRKNILLLLFLLPFFQQGSLKAQALREFSPDSLVFPRQFREYMERYMNEEEMPVVNDFLSFWSASERDTVYLENTRLMLNALLAKRGRPKPHFITLLKIQAIFRSGTTGEQNRLAWEAGLMDALKNPKIPLREIDRFLDNSYGLLTEGVLNRSSSVTWKATSPGFRLEFTDSLLVHFDATDLICYSQRDSEILYNTKGCYMPLTLTWRGQSGKVDWERAGYSRDSVYATLDNYRIDMSKAEYSADSVLFYHTGYFDEPMQGALEEKIKNIISPERATHPLFVSYARRTFVKNLYENIDFEGGFSMQGASLNGGGTQSEPASIYIYRSDTLVLKARSDFFIFRKDRVNSSGTEIVIYMGQDSIFHPEIYFTFGIAKRELALLRTENFMTRSPYFNSLHGMDMQVEQLNWKIDQPLIRLSPAPGSSMGLANFQSENYFKESHYRRLQGIDDNNPLAVINRFSEWYYSETFPAEELARWMNMPPEQVRQTVILLAGEGFLYYDSETDEVTIKDKLHNYLKSSSGKIDYDVVNIVSEVRSPHVNGSLDLRTNYLTVNGVGAIFLSDSQNVAIVPSGNQIILQENRNFLFDGRVEAGLFTFYGQQFHFNYDSFKVSMPAIDSIALRLEETDPETGEIRITEVKNKIEVASGELLIDRANNKSGLSYDPRYPLFSTLKKAFVYYQGKIPGDTSRIKETGIRFEINPFTITGLDHFTREDVVFDGDFESQGILPTFKQTLRMQRDYSLGFTHDVPEEGFPVYGGKGIFYNKVEMSNQGLKGGGKLEHLSASVLSEEFRFFPDSMITTASRFEIARQAGDVPFPEVRSESVGIRWYPKKDAFLTTSGPAPFQMFSGKASMKGTLNLTPGQLQGEGTLLMNRARFDAGKFEFLAGGFRSDSLGFVHYSADGSREIMRAADLSALVDAEKNSGTFTSNDWYSKIEFPENQYITWAGRLDWDAAEDVITLTGQQGRQAATNTLLAAQTGKKLNWYTSTHPQQDSLTFYSPLTRFNTRESILNAEGVEKLDIADAVLIPENQRISVERNARIRTLRNAEVNVFSGELRHRIYEASLDILSRNEYYGSGKYDYINRDGLGQVIFMDDITVDTAYHTLAEGTVSDNKPLLLDPYFEFAGKVKLEASNPYLSFTGGARPLYDCPGIARNYISFSSMIDPLDVTIPVTPEPRAMNNVKIYTGHYITNDSIHIYPAFYSAKKNYSDIQISSATGYMWYDEPSGQYRVGSLEKRADPALAENFIALDRNFCRLHGEGRLDPGIDLGQVSLTTLGDINTDLETGETLLEVMIGLNFFFSGDALTTMAQEIKSIPTLPVLNTNSEDMRKRLALLMGKASSEKVLEELSLYGILNEMPAEMNFSLLLGEVRLKWNPATNSYRSVGKIGIGNIQGTPVNVLVDGHVEIQKRRSGDLMDIYLEIDDNTYYYFGYTRGVMQSISSNTTYRDLLTGLSVKERTMDTKGKGTPYIYMIAVDRKMDMFLRRIRQDINEEEEPQPQVH